MKERGIIMAGDNPRLILEGRKTQTRRVVKVRHSGCGQSVHPAVQSIVHRGDGWWGFEATNRLKDQYITTYPFDTIRCPYGVAGDRLWVRETFARHPEIHATVPGACLYRADRGGDYQGAAQGDFKWTPSIHMPRWASRITLEILKVRVERLQDISARDIQAEGFPYEGPWHDGARVRWYQHLWDSLYGKGAWDKNPWVWVIEFRNLAAGEVRRAA